VYLQPSLETIILQNDLHEKALPLIAEAEEMTIEGLARISFTNSPYKPLLPLSSLALVFGGLERELAAAGSRLR